MVIRWRPKEDMERMENFMRHFFETAVPPGDESSRLQKPSWVPAVDAWETDDDFHMVFDIPGLEKQDISIEVENEQLIIKGERKIDDGIDYMRRERVFGPFFRSFTLETPIERDRIKASYKNGVLEVVLPKKEEVKPKQIKIEIEDE